MSFNAIKVKGFQQKFDSLDSAIRTGTAKATLDGITYYIIHDKLRDEYFLESNVPTIRKWEEVVWQSK